MNKYKRLINEIERLKKIFEGIEGYCKGCDVCCFTYGWLLPCEVDRYSSNEDLVGINKNITCFDSFERDSEGIRILDKIPRCKHYQNNCCEIHSTKPFDCILYPVKILYWAERKTYSVVLSLDCPFVVNMDFKRRSELISSLEEFFETINKEVLRDYLSLVKQWESVSKKKDFDYLFVKEIKEGI